MLFLGRDLLSRQARADQGGDKAPNTSDILGSYGLKELCRRVEIRPDSALIRQPLADLEASLYGEYGLTIVGVERSVRAKVSFLPARPKLMLESGDFIFVLAKDDQVQRFAQTFHGSIAGPLEEKRRQLALQDMGVAELMLTPGSNLIGHPIGEAEVGRRHGLTVLATRHEGEPFSENLRERNLDFGDTLLVSGEWDDINRLRQEREDFLVLTLPMEYEEVLPARGRAPIAVAILVAMVVIMVFSLLPNAAAAITAALAMVATGCVRLDRIYRVISWSTNRADRRHASHGNGTRQDWRHVPDGPGPGEDPRPAGSVSDAARGVPGDGPGGAVHLQFGNGRADRTDGDRGGSCPARFAAGVRHDGGDGLLRRLRHSCLFPHEHARDGARRLCLQRLCEGWPAHAAAEHGRHRAAGQSALSPLAGAISPKGRNRLRDPHSREPAPSAGDRSRRSRA